jgi:CheY-like chemotaxis protein
MAIGSGRILLVDENPSRRRSAATLLILSGYSVLPLDCPELHVTLLRSNYNWGVDLILLRAVLDSETENLLARKLGDVPIQKLSFASALDINLPTMVDKLMRKRAGG